MPAMIAIETMIMTTITTSTEHLRNTGSVPSSLQIRKPSAEAEGFLAGLLLHFHKDYDQRVKGQ
jgi:hypothetical protein